MLPLVPKVWITSSVLTAEGASILANLPRRETHIDAAKVLASHLIVLHHFSVYGPLAEALSAAAPRLADWFVEYALMAVQVFLVIGGYLAAGSLAPRGYFQHPGPWRSMAQRYVRLVLPFGVALLMVLACSAVARQWLQDDFIPPPPSPIALLAHFSLLSDIFDYSSLSVGVWYVAMDFQLFALLAILLWIGGRAALGWVGLCMLSSLFFFNLHESVDSWALYFFGSYGLGAFAWWVGNCRHGGKWLALLVVVGTAALVWDFRLRIGLALLVAMGLGAVRWRLATAAHEPQAAVPLLPNTTPLLGVLSRSSYALFLTHFCIVLLGNVLWTRWGWTFAGAAAWFVAGAWLVCVAVSLLFERFVERPLTLLRVPIRSARPTQRSKNAERS